MTELIYSPDRIGDAQALLTHQLRDKTVLDALIAADAAQSQAIEDAAAQLRARLDIDSQVGVQLDKIGALVGEPRQGRQDAEYRLWLKARIRVNRSSGSPKDLYAIAYILLGADADLFLAQIPVGQVLEVAGAFPAADVVAVQRLLQEASPIAVPFYQQYARGAYDRIECAAGATPVAASPNGFDNGRLVDWAGPDQTVDYYAGIETLGLALVDCWDCRATVYDGSGTALRLPGARSEFAPFFRAPSVEAYPTRGTPNVKGIAPCSLSAQKAFETTRYLELFGGSDPWTIGMHITTGADFDDHVFEAANDPAIEAGAAAYNIKLIVTTSATTLTLYAGGANTTFTFPGVASGTELSLIVTYDGAGNAAAWINGAQSVDTGTHRAVPGLTSLAWGAIKIVEDATPFDGYKLALFNRVLADAEVAKLHAIFAREFTDNAYY